MKKLLIILFVLFFSTVYAQQTVGLFTNTDASFNGYTLFGSISSTQTFLIDNCGHKINEWTSDYTTGHAAYLLPDGSLLRAGNVNSSYFSTAGKGGIIEKFDWNNNLVWSYTIATNIINSHHDIKALPNGNVLAIVWEKKLASEAIAAGRNPAYVGTNFFSEIIMEIQPVGIDSGIVVWEWKVFDHLIQHYDATKENYGVIPEHPELININFNQNVNPDWLHMNSVAYNEELDQIVISPHNFNEIWVIDHSTTMSEAAGHTGGNCGKGGDLLYRWGNPAAYASGTLPNGVKKLFGQHDVQWISPGLPHAGKILIYNNGINRPAGLYSTIEIIDPPLLPDGNYLLNAGEAYGPAATDFTFPQVPDLTFYSSNISSAQQMPNGNILICEGDNGEFFEIDSIGQIVWRYVNPSNTTGFITQGTAPSNNNVFKIRRYEPSFSGFTGRDMTPGPLLELNPYPDNCILYTGTENVGISNPINIMPNPARDYIFIDNKSNKIQSVQVINCLGEVVLSESADEFSLSLNVKNLMNGIYFIVINKTNISKFVIAK